MLSTVLQKIEEFFSKYTLLSAFYPILIFAFVNLFLLFKVSAGFHRWLLTRTPHADLETLLQGSVAAVGIALATFFLSTISYFLRELIEGRHWPDRLSNALVPLQEERLKTLVADGDKYSLLRFQFRRKFKNMRLDLNAARDLGTKANKDVCKYAGSPEIERLRNVRTQGLLFTVKELEDAVKVVEAALSANDADAVGNDAAAAVRLDLDSVDLDQLLAYAKGWLDQKLIDVFAQQQLGFGDSTLRPTAAGNMVQAVAAYAMSRYDFSIDLLWSRLQSVLQKETLEKLQLAKAELDSLIALWWLSMITWISWWIISGLKTATGIFITVAIVGPVLTSLLYFLIIASYRGFHDQLRSAVDLNRFELLKALHLPLPVGPNEERAVWKSLGAFAQYGDAFSGAYEHK